MDKKSLACKLNSKTNDVEVVKLEELKPNSFYKIIETNKFQNKFGKDCVLATIERKGKKLKVFLPSKFSKQTKWELEAMVGLEFRYEGKEKGNKFEYHKLYFNEECDDSEDQNEYLC